MRDGPCGHVCGHDTFVSLSTTSTDLGPWLLGCDQVPDRSHPRHLLCICRQLEAHGAQRADLKVGSRRVVGEDKLLQARPSPGIGPQLQRLAQALRNPVVGLFQAKAVDGTGPPLSPPPRARGSAGALCELQQMETRSGDFELTTDELRAIAAYAVACAEPALVIFAEGPSRRPSPGGGSRKPRASSPRERPVPASNGPPRPTPTARPGTPRPNPPGTQRALQGMPPPRHTSIPWRRRRRCATSSGSAAHAARAAELARGDDPVVAEYVVTAAAKRATPVVLDVLGRYPRAPKGRSRIAVLMQRLDSLLRDPPPTPRVVDDPGPFFHGTRADVRPGDLLTPGWRSNYGSQRQSNHIYLTATREGAPLAAELARGEGPGTGLPGRAPRHDRGRPERHRQALPRQPDPVLPDDRAAAGRRGDHGLGASSAGDDPAHARAHGRAGRARDRGDGRLTRAAPPLLSPGRF